MCVIGCRVCGWCCVMCIIFSDVWCVGCFVMGCCCFNGLVVGGSCEGGGLWFVLWLIMGLGCIDVVMVDLFCGVVWGGSFYEVCCCVGCWMVSGWFGGWYI